MTPDVFMCLNCHRRKATIYCRPCCDSMNITYEMGLDDLTDERDAASERLHMKMEGK